MARFVTLLIALVTTFVVGAAAAPHHRKQFAADLPSRSGRELQLQFTTSQTTWLLQRAGESDNPDHQADDDNDDPLLLATLERLAPEQRSVPITLLAAGASIDRHYLRMNERGPPWACRGSLLAPFALLFLVRFPSPVSKTGQINNTATSLPISALP